jgi:dTDP-4-amino-4,6-dideoxygalactose transaminase
MTEVCAAMGLTNLESIADLIAINLRNYECYRAELRGLMGVSVIEYLSHEKYNYQYVVVEMDPSLCPLNRDELVAVLHAENVLARKYFWPGCHNMEPYRSFFPHAGLLLAETERVAARIMLLPTGQAVTSEAIKTICGIIRQSLGEAAQIRTRLKEITK